MTTKTNGLNHVINLVIGGDGCDRETNFTIKTNLNKKALNKAYRDGVKKCGVDWVKEVCADENSDQSDVEEVGLEKLKQNGFVPGPEFYVGPTNGNWNKVNPWTNFAGVWLFICSLGNSKLSFEFAEGEIDTINIGGHGLFDWG